MGLHRLLRAEAHLCLSEWIDESLGMASARSASECGELDVHASHPSAVGALRQRRAWVGQGPDGRSLSTVGGHAGTATPWNESVQRGSESQDSDRLLWTDYRAELRQTAVRDHR